MKTNECGNVNRHRRALGPGVGKLPLWGYRGARPPGADAAVAAVSGPDETLKGEETQLLWALARLSLHASRPSFPPTARGLRSSPEAPSLS